MLTCVIINHATSASGLAAQITPAWLQEVGQACQLQLTRDVAPSWGLLINAVRVGTTPLPGELAFAITDTLPDAPGAIAYHDVDGDTHLPDAYLALSTCQTLNDVSTAISHELCEATGDPACNRWADDGNTHEWALELCDAVESGAYPMPNGILVSDFLLPAFFAPGAPGPWNFMSAHGGGPTGPFQTASGGYQIQRASGGGETQVTGVMHQLHLARKSHWSSRTFRRGAYLRPNATPNP